MLKRLIDIVFIIADFSIWALGIGCLFILKAVYLRICENDEWKFNGMIGIGLCSVSTFFSLLSMYLAEKERIKTKKLSTIEFYSIFFRWADAPTEQKWQCARVKNGWEVFIYENGERKRLMFIDHTEEYGEKLARFIVESPVDIIRLLDSYRSECECEYPNERQRQN